MDVADICGRTSSGPGVREASAETSRHRFLSQKPGHRLMPGQVTHEIP